MNPQPRVIVEADMIATYKKQLHRCTDRQGMEGYGHVHRKMELVYIAIMLGADIMGQGTCSCSVLISVATEIKELLEPEHDIWWKSEKKENAAFVLFLPSAQISQLLFQMKQQVTCISSAQNIAFDAHDYTKALQSNVHLLSYVFSSLT